MKVLYALLVLLFVICAFATPQNCNGESSGNALSVADSDTYDGNEDYDKPLPIDEKFMFAEDFKEEVHQPVFPKNKLEEKEKAQKKLNVQPVLRKKGSLFNTVKRGNFKAVNKIVKPKQVTDGLKTFKAGVIQFVELDEKMREQCLKEYFFCSIDCAVDFSMTCKDPKAKIFSTFVTKSQHANNCVAPRTREIRRNLAMPVHERLKQRQQCVLRPCSCKAYEGDFIRQYGKQEFDRALKILQGMCNQWCTTGTKPKGVIDESQAKKTINIMKAKLLAMYRIFFKWLGQFLDFGKAAGKHIKEGAEFVGKNIKKGAVIVGNHVKKGAVVVGNGFKTGARHIAGGAKKVGNAFRHAGRRVGGAFRHAGRRVGGAFRSAGRRVGRFFRRFRRW